MTYTPIRADYVCKVCDAGPGNDDVCLCGIEAWEEPEPKIDFDSPEDVLIEVVCDAPEVGPPSWKAHTIESCTILYGKEGVTGAASYEQAYGSFLDYTIEGIIDCPGAGFFVVEGITADYIKGDGWMTDDDMRFHCTGVRPATEEERKMT